MKKRGAKSTFSKAMAARICGLIAIGHSLVSICERKRFPSYSTVMLWLNTRREFSEMYARAREDQADYLADEICEIADSATPLNVHVARLRVEARKWSAMKLKPRKYGERLTSEVSGPDGGPIKHQQVGPVVVRLVNGDGTPLLALKPDAKR
jgi:hypothetical protein